MKKNIKVLDKDKFTLMLSKQASRQAGKQASRQASKQDSLRLKALFLFILISISASPLYGQFYRNFFAEGEFHKYLLLAGLQDYTIPKPGWSLKAGYTWDFSRKHHASVLFQTGHRVVSGENPLVRTLDIYPFSLSGEYSFSIFPWFSIGIQGGGGLFYSRISHYETVVDILTQNLSTTKGTSAFISCMANANFSLFESSTNFMLGLGIECISEKEGLIPVPAFSLGLRCYPVRMWQYGKKPLIKEVEKIVEIEVPVERRVIIEKEVIEEESVVTKTENPSVYESTGLFNITEITDEGKFITVYFGTGASELSQEEISKLDTLGEYLEKVPGAGIILEGNSAPFDFWEQRYTMGLSRANTVRDYLTENYDIDLVRINIKSVGSQRSGGFVPGLANEAYSRYRTVRIFIVPGTDQPGQNPSPAQKEPEDFPSKNPQDTMNIKAEIKTQPEEENETVGVY